MIVFHFVNGSNGKPNFYYYKWILLIYIHYYFKNVKVKYCY